MSDAVTQALYERIYQAVALVPAGAVASYGDIATVVGDGCDARTVGYALNELPKAHAIAIPWQRVISATGGISTRGPRQRHLLEAEGVVFDARDRVEMARFRWAGPDPDWAAAHGFYPLPSRQSSERGAQMRLF